MQIPPDLTAALVAERRHDSHRRAKQRRMLSTLDRPVPAGPRGGRSRMWRALSVLVAEDLRSA